MGTKIYRKIVLAAGALLLFACVFLTGCGDTQNESEGKTESGKNEWSAILQETAAAQMSRVERPACASIGGEWTVIALSRAGIEAEKSYWEIYLTNLKKTLKETGGVLSENKYTEYSRVILALTALGENPADFDGHNLLANLADFDAVVKQGVNGPAYALIALDSGDYEMPETENAATREQYVEYILEKERETGGFSLSANADASEADLTAMVLQSLIPYQEQEEVKAMIERCVEALSAQLDENGYYISFDEVSCESTAQAVIALSALGIDCNEDERFVKNGKGMMDVLFTFYDGEGGFAHTLDGETNVMATEQAMCAVVAYERFKNGENSIFDMTDVK